MPPTSAAIPNFHFSLSPVPLPQRLPFPRNESVVLVPAYFFPYDDNNPGTHNVGPYWSTLIEAAKLHGNRLVVIANPNNGPGSGTGWENQKYQEAITKVRNEGAVVIGYVHVCYGLEHHSAACNNRTLQDIHSDIDKWMAWYNVDGIFLDETATQAPKLQWHQDLVQYIKSVFGEDGSVYMNYGVMPNTSYISNMPNVIHGVFENTPSAFDAQFAQIQQSSLHNQTTILIHSENGSDWQQLKNKILSDIKVQGFYITNDTFQGNPWDSLPPYFMSLFD
ncbi:MAG: spherulation-specific family 4 protein [Bacteroidota bacterium]